MSPNWTKPREGSYATTREIMKYQIQAFDNDGNVEILDTFDNRSRAEYALLQAQEGDDKHDPCEYLIVQVED